MGGHLGKGPLPPCRSCQLLDSMNALLHRKGFVVFHCCKGLGPYRSYIGTKNMAVPLNQVKVNISEYPFANHYKATDMNQSPLVMDSYGFAELFIDLLATCPCQSNPIRGLSMPPGTLAKCGSIANELGPPCTGAQGGVNVGHPEISQARYICCYFSRVSCSCYFIGSI